MFITDFLYGFLFLVYDSWLKFVTFVMQVANRLLDGPKHAEWRLLGRDVR